MAITTSNIQFGPGRIYLGATLPGLDAQPIFTAGVPAGGIDIGGTLSATINIKTDIEAIMVEQAMAPVDVVGKKLSVSIDLEVAEIDITNLNKYLATSTLVTTVTPNFIQGGSKSAVTIVSGIVVVQPRRGTTTEYSYIMLYKAFLPDGISLPFAREKASFLKIKFEGMSDLSRADNDQVYQISNRIVSL